MDRGLYFCTCACDGFGLAGAKPPIPCSHTLFIGPQSCGRLVSLSSFRDGTYERYSNLFITEYDLVAGDLESSIVSAVGTILDRLKERPRFFMVYYACPLSISGADTDLLERHLSKGYPDILFYVTGIDPVSADVSRYSEKYVRLAHLFDQSEQDGSLNIFGNSRPIAESCELFHIMKGFGATGIRQMASMSTLDELHSLGHSKWNLLLNDDFYPMGKSLSPRMGFVSFPVTYGPSSIAEGYSRLFSMIGRSTELSGYELKCVDSIKDTVDSIGDVHLSIGSSCSLNPLSLARFLSENGFKVTDVFTNKQEPAVLNPWERESYLWLRKKGGIRFHLVTDVMIRDVIGRCGGSELAIGYDAAYYSGAEHYLPLFNDDDHFGFDGTVRLMKRLRDSAENENTLLCQRPGVTGR